MEIVVIQRKSIKELKKLNTSRLLEYYRAERKRYNVSISQYHWGFDDVDLCLSIYYNMNKKVLYCGSTNIYHEDSSSLKKVPTNRLFLNHNLVYLKNKWKDRYCLDSDIYEKDRKFNLYHK